MKITKRSDGRLTAAVNLGPGKRRFVYGSTPEEVERKATLMRAAYLEGRAVPSAKGSTGEFLDRWLEHLRRERRVRASTIADRENYVRAYLKPKLAGVLLAKLQPEHVQELVNDLLDKGLAASTVRHALIVLRASLKQARRWKLVADNVASPDFVDSPRVRRKEARFLSDDEVKRLLPVLSGHRLGAMYVTMMLTGMRPAETFGLRWENVDLEAGVLHVHEQVAWTKAGKRRVPSIVSDLKTAGSRRDLSIPEPLVTTLRAHRAAQKRERLVYAKEWASAPIPGLVFTTLHGRPVQHEYARKALRGLLVKAELGHATPYALRHSWASLALLAGVAPRLVMEQLGHSQIAQTMNTYSHVIATLQREAADKVSAVIFPAPAAPGK